MSSPSDGSNIEAGPVLKFTSVEQELSRLFDRADKARTTRPSRAIVIKPGAARPRLWPYPLVLACVAAAGVLVGAMTDELAMIFGRSNPGPTPSSAALELRTVRPLSAAIDPQVAVSRIDPAPKPPTAAPAAKAAAPPAAERAASASRAARSQQSRSAPRTSEKASSCAGLTGAAEQRCAYPKLLAADRRLRHAYERAAEAKVPRQALVSYQRRWSRLRGEARRDPERVARAYDRLAAELRQAARDRR